MINTESKKVQLMIIDAKFGFLSLFILFCKTIFPTILTT